MKKNIKLPTVKPVKIKPLFGIKPSIWLTVAYAIALIFVVFVICFLPGIKKGQKRVSFSSTAGITAVYVDSKYIGGTPFTTFVKSGTHTAEFKVNGETLDKIEFKVGHPVFLTWLFPRNMSVKSNKGLNDTTYSKLTRSFLEDVSNYSAILEYDNITVYPPLFTNYASALLSYEYLESSDYKDVLNTALSFITTNEMLNDAENAYKLLGLSYDFEKIEYAVENGSFKKETERLIGLSRIFTSSLTCPYFERSGISVNGFTFDNYPVSEAMYYYFVKDNPQWAKTETQNLMEKGLVDEYYLEGVSLSADNTSRPVRNISFYAAQAFCEWLSEKSGKTVFIPEELQWTTGANFGSDVFQKTLVPAKSETGASGVLGSVWELTSTPYVPLLSLFDYSVYDILKRYDIQAEVIIKGGSYISDDSVTTYSIGTAPRSLCSDYMGFRIVWR